MPAFLSSLIRPKVAVVAVAALVVGLLDVVAAPGALAAVSLTVMGFYVIGRSFR